MELRAQLRHPNIVDFYGVVLELKQPAVIVTELCEGSAHELVIGQGGKTPTNLYRCLTSSRPCVLPSSNIALYRCLTSSRPCVLTSSDTVLFARRASASR